MIKLKDLLKENPADYVDKNIDSKELLYRKKKYYIEAAKIKKVKNVSVQYMDAEYLGDMAFSGYFKKVWLYKKDNGEYFAVVITNNRNRYEVQLGKHKDKFKAEKAAEKIIKKNLNKFESINEITYKFKGYTASNMDELDAMLSRAGIKGTPNFNDMTYSVNKKSSKIDRIMKMKGGKKIKPIRLRGKSGMGKISHLGMESVNEARGTCWVGYQQIGMKKKGNKMVPNCVKEIYWENELGESCGYTFELEPIQEAEYQGRKVKLNKIMQGDQKKFKVYVKNPKGNVVKVNFGQGGDAKGGTMRIRKSNPAARKSFRARHNCDNPGPKHKARYWSCRKW